MLERAERLRFFERQRHDNLATTTYRDFFTPIASLAIRPLLEEIRFQDSIDLLDAATGPGSVAAAAHGLGAKTVGVDLSPGTNELAAKSHPGTDFRVAEVREGLVSIALAVSALNTAQANGCSGGYSYLGAQPEIDSISASPFGEETF